MATCAGVASTSSAEVLAVQAAAVGVVGAGRPVHLRGDYERLPIPVREPVADPRLAVAAAVDVGGIDEPAAGVGVVVEQFVGPVPVDFQRPAFGLAAEPPGAEGDFRNVEPGVSEGDVVERHVSIRYFCSTALIGTVTDVTSTDPVHHGRRSRIERCSPLGRLEQVMIPKPKRPPASDGTSPRKGTLFCRECGHRSPSDGDWIVETRSEAVPERVVHVCPDCRTVIQVRPVYGSDDADTLHR
jgi:hypothetical protein